MRIQVRRKVWVRRRGALLLWEVGEGVREGDWLSHRMLMVLFLNKIGSKVAGLLDVMAIKIREEG